ncbi:MAG: response regulator transcription factor [Bacteroidetes bacterium]|nr:response regulator transcription factor [Bacteroidota bacterium]
MKLIIADDHQIMIDGLKSILQGHAHISITGIAKNGVQVLEILKKERADIVLTDISMPDMDGIELTRTITSSYPRTRVIALSMHGDTAHINGMIEAGVAGYIYKNASNKELIDALDKVNSGGQYFSDAVAGTIIRSMNEQVRLKQEEERVNLTDREREIIDLIAKEHSNADIGRQLSISERTVETHRKNIYRKTNTTTIVGLIKWAYENKVI